MKSRFFVRFALIQGALALIVMLSVAFSSAAPQDERPVQVVIRDRPQNLGIYADSNAGIAAATAVAKLGDVQYGVMNLEFNDETDCKNFEVEGGHIRVITRYKRFAQIMYRLEDVKEATEELKRHANLFVWFDWPQPATAKPIVPPNSEQAAKKAPKSLFSKGVPGHDPVRTLTGKGVIIAIIDTGVDFRHPDFITTDSNGKKISRLRYFWDTTEAPRKEGEPGKNAEIKLSDGAVLPVGVIYKCDELSASLQEDSKLLPIPDDDGQGTACAGIAAGNGAGTNNKLFKGVAPDADIIAVRLKGSKNTILNGSNKKDMVQNDWLLYYVCDWLDNEATKKDEPMVITCGFGGAWGGRDGTAVAERMLNARFPTSRKGRLICFPVGDEGTMGRHIQASFDQSQKAILEWQASKSETVEIYVNATDPDDVLVTSDEIKEENIKKYIHGISGSLVVRFSVPKGNGSVSLKAKRDLSFQADAYISSEKKTVTTSEVSGFIQPPPQNARQIDTPATAACALAVGSYSFNDQIDSLNGPQVLLSTDGKELKIDDLTPDSNRGSLRVVLDSAKPIKPDFVSPGQWLIAAAPKHVINQLHQEELQMVQLKKWDKPKHSNMIHSSGLYRAVSGTHVATSYTAGVCALLLDQKKDLSMDDLRLLLKKPGVLSANVANMGKTPNPLWGYGKLDEDAVGNLVEQLK